jgi:signal transduction histidine kinase
VTSAIRPAALPARLAKALLSTTWLLWLMILLEAAFAIGLLLSDYLPTPISTVGLAIATQWVPVTIFWLVGVRTRFQRWEVTFAALAVSVSAIGDTYYSLAMDSSGYLAFPSYADIGYLLFYPLMVASLIALVRKQAKRGYFAAVMLDSTVAALGAAAVLAVILGPVLGEALSGASFLESAVAVSYPLLDVVLVAAIVGIAASPALDIGTRWLFLVLGLLTFATGDVVYALLENSGAYIAGTPLDAVWTLGLALIAWWVDGIGRSDAYPPPRTHRLLVPVPAIAVAAGLGVLLWGTQLPLSPLALALAAGTVGLAAIPVMFRQAVLSRLIAGQEQVVRQLQDLDRSKSEVMATIDHELRTPLTSIRGYLELVVEGEGGPIPAEAARMLRVVEQNTERLEGLVDDMLLMWRLDDRISPSKLEVLELEPILARVVDAIYPLASSRDVDVSLECEKDLPRVEGDRIQLERVFAGILENAVKFTPAGGGVRVVAHPGVTRDGEATVVVNTVDTGIGIPKSEIALLFTRFFRASNAKVDAVRGSGLGLAIVKSLVKAHGGTIAVTSELGVGTTVRVALPGVIANEGDT